MPAGTIEVELRRGYNLKDVELFGKSDPYAVVSVDGNYGVKSFRSKTIHNGGSNPVWNENCLLDIPDGPTKLDIAVFDKEKHGCDEPMGVVCIPLERLFQERHILHTKYKLQLPNGKHRGEIELNLKFTPKVQHGILKVHLVEARALIDADFFGKSDPYVRIECQKIVQQSVVIEGGGSNPVWKQHFNFQVDSRVNELDIKLFDKDVLKPDDALGALRVPLQNVFLTGHVQASWYPVLGDKGQPQGEIKLELEFEPKPTVDEKGIPSQAI